MCEEKSSGGGSGCRQYWPARRSRLATILYEAVRIFNLLVSVWPLYAFGMPLAALLSSPRRLCILSFVSMNTNSIDTSRNRLRSAFKASSTTATKVTSADQEHWDHIQDAALRKKVQNRIAQRSYRIYTSFQSSHVILKFQESEWYENMYQLSLWQAKG